MQAFFSTSKGLESSLNLCKPVLVQRMSDNAVSTLLEVFWSSCTAQKQACTIFTGPSHRSKQFCRSYLVLKHACTSFIRPPTRLEWLYWTFSTLNRPYTWQVSQGIIRVWRLIVFYLGYTLALSYLFIPCVCSFLLFTCVHTVSRRLDHLFVHVTDWVGVL